MAKYKNAHVRRTARKVWQEVGIYTGAVCGILALILTAIELANSERLPIIAVLALAGAWTIIRAKK